MMARKPTAPTTIPTMAGVERTTALELEELLESVATDDEVPVAPAAAAVFEMTCALFWFDALALVVALADVVWAPVQGLENSVPSTSCAVFLVRLLVVSVLLSAAAVACPPRKRYEVNSAPVYVTVVVGLTSAVISARPNPQNTHLDA